MKEQVADKPFEGGNTKWGSKNGSKFSHWNRQGSWGI